MVLKKIILSREIDLSDYERIIYAVLERKLTNVREHDFVKNRFLGVGKRHAIIGWMVSNDRSRLFHNGYATMSDEQKQPLTYQAKAMVQALMHGAYSLGCVALGDIKGSFAHTKAAAAWAALAVYAEAAVKLGKIPQWFMDAMWVEPAPLYVDDEAAN